MNSMEEAVLDIFRKKYKREYIGKIKVEGTPTGYCLTLNLGIPDVELLTISADLNAEDFLKFIEKELVDRQLHRGKRYKYEKRDTYC